jgi:hypothetical protein
MEEVKDYCVGCHTKYPVSELTLFEKLCPECDAKYDNKTGYCSLDCCLGGGCDGSC